MIFIFSYITCRDSTFARLSCPDNQNFDPYLGVCTTEFSCKDEETVVSVRDRAGLLTTSKKPKVITSTTQLIESEEEDDVDDEDDDEDNEIEESQEGSEESVADPPTASPEDSIDYQNFKELCIREKNGTKLSNCSDPTHRSYVECILSKDPAINFIRRTCKAPTIFCGELQRCTTTSKEPCACVKEFNHSVYLPYYPFYPIKHIEYNQTCRHELKRFKTDQIAIPNPFNRVEFFICRKSGNAANVGVEWGRCCNGFEFCATIMQCAAPIDCPARDSAKRFEYVFSLGNLDGVEKGGANYAKSLFKK